MYGTKYVVKNYLSEKTKWKTVKQMTRTRWWRVWCLALKKSFVGQKANLMFGIYSRGFVLFSRSKQILSLAGCMHRFIFSRSLQLGFSLSRFDSCILAKPKRSQYAYNNTEPTAASSTYCTFGTSHAVVASTHHAQYHVCLHKKLSLINGESSTITMLFDNIVLRVPSCCEKVLTGIDP